MASVDTAVVCAALVALRGVVCCREVLEPVVSGLVGDGGVHSVSALVAQSRWEPYCGTAAEQAGTTRELILTTAERLFTEHGVSAVSNRQIAEAAGGATPPSWGTTSAPKPISYSPSHASTSTGSNVSACRWLPKRPAPPKLVTG